MTFFISFFFFFSIELEPYKSEVDITIVDRICALLNPQPICVCNPVSNNKNTVSYQFLLYNYIKIYIVFIIFSLFYF